MKKYLIVNSMDEVIEVEGTEVKIFPWIKTFIYHDPKYAKPWTVTEVTTGHAIAHQKTRKKVIEQAHKTLKYIGEENVVKQINTKPKIYSDESH